MDPRKPTVTVNPPKAATASSAETISKDVLIDSKGRKITLRELTLLEEQDLMAAMPESHCRNALVLGRALLAARVATINGEDQDVPITPAQYRAMLHAVGKEGLDVISASLISSDDKEDVDGDILDKAKNS